MVPSLDTSERFWKDVKALQKKLHHPDFESSLSDDAFRLASPEERVESVKQLLAISNTLRNAVAGGIVDQISDKCGRQPFLRNGWVIRKKRWAINGKGQSNGLRVIFCVSTDNTQLVLVLIALKKDITDETDLEKEYEARIKRDLIPD